MRSLFHFLGCNEISKFEHSISGYNISVRFYPSADEHGVSHEDALHVIENARTVIVLREDPRKLLYIGFDTSGLPREVIVDKPPWEDGEDVCIHADTLTRAWFKYL